MADVTSVLGTLNALATGGAVSLGPMILTGFEVPSRINFGGNQQLVVHKFPGGARVIDSLGDDPATPTWKGSFTGPLAATRARQMNALRLAAQSVTLSFGPFTAQVVIKRFTASYERNGFWIPYSIVCEVLPPSPDSAEIGGTALAGTIGDDVAVASAAVSDAAAQTATLATSAIQQASSALAQTTSLGNLAALTLGGITAALNSGTAIVAGVTNLAQSPGAAGRAAAQFQSAATAIGDALDATGAGLGTIGAAATVAGSDPVASLNDLTNAAVLAGATAQLAQAGGYAARAANNAATAATPGSIGS